MFCSIHNHTEYSSLKLLDSINRIPQLVDKAIEYGFNGLAITDHEILSGHIEALQVGDKIREKHPEFKIILGNEIYLLPDEQWEEAGTQKLKYWHFILLAKDREGHRQIRELSSRAWKRAKIINGTWRTPTLFSDVEEIVKTDRGHLIASTACLGGLLDHFILEKNGEGAGNFINWMIENFGQDNCFLEMQDAATSEQEECNKQILRLSEYFEIPFIVTQDAHYLVKDDFTLFEKYLNSRDEKDREVGAFYSYTYLKTEQEMHEIMDSQIGKKMVDRAIENTQLIYNVIQPFDLRAPIEVPLRKLPEFKVRHILKDWYEKYQNIKYYAYSEYEQDRFLMYNIENGIEKKRITINDTIMARIDIELYTLKVTSEGLNQRMSAYLNLVQKNSDLMWEVSLVGVSRGSAMSFFINYLIDIVQANPILYEIPYWRFMNTASAGVGGKGAVLPDIDQDVSPAKAKEVMARLQNYYGEENILNTLTYKRESLKSAIQTAGRGLNISLEVIQPLSAMVPISRGHVYTLKECEEGDAEKGFEPAPQLIAELKKIPNLYETVKKIEGLISGRGIHASAVYIFNNGYLEKNAMMRAPNGTPITAYDYRGSDDCGALKIDLLYTEAQSKLMKCMELMLKYGAIEWQGSLRATYNKYLHPDIIDYKDYQMWEDMADGKIPDLFQFSTPVGGVCIKRIRPKNIVELSSANAVMRLMGEPGKEAPLDRYVRMKKDINEWYKEMDEWGLTEKEQEVMKRLYNETAGNCMEQEPMMLTMMDSDISSFTLAEANGFRKVVSKKKLNKIQEYKVKYFSKADEE